MDHSNHEYDFVDDLLARRDTRRERCRVSQARYRRKQKNYVTDIQAAVTQLGNEIMKLQIDQQMILFGASTKESVWGIAAEYFRVFRHGFISHTALPCSREGMISPQSHVQLKFLQATMSNDVTRGVLRGVHALLENWRLFTMYHSDVQLNLERLDGGPRGSVVATGTTVITITENTLRNLYPHLLIGDAIWTPLARRLLNQRIEMATSICFGWDESSRCVTRLDTKIDMLTPMLRILGSLKILAHVFNGARISLEDVLIRAQ
ncbi:hypothetical protein PHMEG_00031154 [Phytophthora megakarya]|uniref:Bzip transcription factor n=1 Tax=Phytophthora megakarya TaxID=4795 RepID=A0A225UYC5_9STRA|nr:hypothetical protein PHMEG_00031154 [Phytophthora megakarya]